MKASYSRRIKKAYADFRSDPAGERFENLYDRSRKLPPYVRLSLGGLGLVCGIGGLLLGLVPGVPGIVLGAAGFALMAAQFRPVAVGSDHAEVYLREFWSDLRSHFVRHTRKKKRIGSPVHRRPVTRRHPKVKSAAAT